MHARAILSFNRENEKMLDLLNIGAPFVYSCGKRTARLNMYLLLSEKTNWEFY
jgi:hypothetical protein